MSIPKEVLQKDHLALEGFEPLLNKDGPEDGPVVVEGLSEDGTADTQDSPGGGPIVQEISADEAAILLGISVRAVLKRLNKGTLKGRKVATKFGEKWLVDSSELPRTVHVDFDEQDGPPNQEAQYGPSTGSFEDGPKDGPQGRGYLGELALAQSLSNQGELIATVLKQSQIIEQLTNDVRQKDQQLKLLTDRQHVGTSWPKFWDWMLGRRG